MKVGGVLFCLIVGLVTPALSFAQASLQPNIIYIMLDDVDIQDLSAFGATDTYTPTLDALAQSGMIFKNFYAPAAVCSPSRVGMLTSRFPLELGYTRSVVEASPVLPSLSDNLRFKGGIPKEVPTVAEILSPTYQTAHFGKWHVGLWKDEFAPPAKGFDQSHILKRTYFLITELINNKDVNHFEGYRPTVLTNRVIDYIDNRDPSKPFFANLWYIVPHAPLHVPPGYENTRGFDLESPRGKLSSMLHHLDGQVKRIIDKLETEGIAQNTLVMLTSDNGGLVTPTKRPERLYKGFKNSMFDGGIRVPFIASMPGTIPSNTNNYDVTSMLDIFPTILEFAGLQNNERMEGKSMYDTLVNGMPSVERDLLWAKTSVWQPNIEDESGYTAYAFRRGNYKVVKSARHTRPNLYNIETDPFETSKVRTEEPHKFRELDNEFIAKKVALTRIPESEVNKIKKGAVDNGDGSYSFSGSGSEVYLGRTSYHEFSGTSGTIDFTFTYNALDQVSTRLLAKKGSYRISMSRTGKVSIALYGYDEDGQSKRIHLRSQQRLLPGQEYNITLTSLFHKNWYNSYRLYVDHTLQDEKRDEESLYVLGTASDGLLRLGSPASNGQFDGKISHPEIYKTFFNAEEIATL